MRVLLILFLFSATVSAQSSSSLRQKYGEPASETFRLRPQISLIVSYAKTGEVCRMLVEPKSIRIGRLKVSAAETIKDKLMDEILEELAPKNQRGKFLSRTHRFGLLEDYEQVEILLGGGTDKWLYGAIYWKIQACEN